MNYIHVVQENHTYQIEKINVVGQKKGNCWMINE